MSVSNCKRFGLTVIGRYIVQNIWTCEKTRVGQFVDFFHEPKSYFNVKKLSYFDSRLAVEQDYLYLL